MKTTFIPNYLNIQKAALNQANDRLPLYEHSISLKIMEKITNIPFITPVNGNIRDWEEYYHNYCEFFKNMGYDTVSIEFGISRIMPGGGSLSRHDIEPAIRKYQDYEKYPWNDLPEYYFAMYDKRINALRNVMPEGMKAIGGVGSGIFECVQNLTGYLNLCYISKDDPTLYTSLFNKIGEVSFNIWNRFINLYGDIFCVMRFGDDLGFKNGTLIPPDDIINLIIPEYAKIINLVHSSGKPFLLHSCGNIAKVMPQLIHTAKIDAKHSNEDQILPFPELIKEYGNSIGIFGGIDVNSLCQLSPDCIKKHITNMINACGKKNGIAIGSGNSIPDWTPVENYVAMTEAVRMYRGETIF